MFNYQRLLHHCKYVNPRKKFILSDKMPCISKKNKICFFMHGTSGFSKNCVNYLKILHKLGFTVIAPDHNAYHHYICKIFAQQKYCGRHLHFNTTSHFATRNTLLYNYVAHFRKKELECCFQIFKDHIDIKKAICVGVSEGAIATSLACVPVSKKFIFSYSIERNYFTPKMPVVNVYAGQKIIQIIGTKDEYFGPLGIASKLRAHIIGHGQKTFRALKTKNYNIYLLKNQSHSLLQKNLKQNAKIIKAILYSHLGAKQKRISPKFATLYFKING